MDLSWAHCKHQATKSFVNGCQRSLASTLLQACCLFAFAEWAMGVRHWHSLYAGIGSDPALKVVVNTAREKDMNSMVLLSTTHICWAIWTLLCDKHGVILKHAKFDLLSIGCTHP